MVSSAPAFQATASTREPKPEAQQRYVALDAFRGFIMFTLASEGFGFGALRNDPTYGRVANWFEHVDWTGAVFWDLIQPAFMFMVGLAMPFALARRAEQGATFRQQATHVGVRALKLILLSQVLMIISEQRIHFQLINVLSQIAFAYVLTFCILQLRFRWQVAVAVLLLAGHWALFAAFPGPQGAFSRTGNIGAVLDKALLGYNYPGYYVTINFITSTVTTLFGAWTGLLLRSSRPLATKLAIVAGAAVALLVGGSLLAIVNPMIKRLWTESFTLYSAGWVLVMLLGFLLIAEVGGWRRLLFPLTVVGMNSIFIYSAGFLVRGSIVRWVNAFTGGFKFAGVLAPVAQYCAVMLVLWYMCYWLYKRQIFIKL